jgi:hypothetical protein
MITGDEFEEDKGGVEEPEGGSAHGFVETADPAEEGVRGEEGQLSL